MSISIDNIRVGHNYVLTNFGEASEFQVLDKLYNGDFKLKDVYSLEEYKLFDLFQFGKGDDFSILERSS